MAIYTLPRDSLIYMDNKIIEVMIPDDTVIDKKIKFENIENAKGILKAKKIDPLEYQRKIRDEWD